MKLKVTQKRDELQSSFPKNNTKQKPHTLSWGWSFKDPGC